MIQFWSFKHCPCSAKVSVGSVLLSANGINVDHLTREVGGEWVGGIFSQVSSDQKSDEIDECLKRREYNYN